MIVLSTYIIGKISYLCLISTDGIILIPRQGPWFTVALLFQALNPTANQCHRCLHFTDDITATSDTGLLPEDYIARAYIPRLYLLPQLPIGVGVGI